MDELSFPVVEALKAAGSSPLALCAFALLVAAMLVVSLRVRRNGNLLKNLQKLPSKDRLAALKQEMGGVEVKGGLDPEQWLRHNSRQYLLGAFVALCVTVIVLVAIVVGKMREEAPKGGVRIELAPQSIRGPAADGEIRLRPAVWTGGPPSSANGGSDVGTPDDRAVVYQAELDRSGVTRITYRSPYFRRVAAGGPIEGINHLEAPFRWKFPELAVTVGNPSVGTMVLSEARIRVIAAQPLDEVWPVFEDLSVDRLVVRNEGWGNVVAPHLEFAVSDVREDDDVGLFAPKISAVDLPTFGDRADVPLAPYLTDALKRRSVVQVEGTLTHGAPAERQTLRFRTRVSLQVRAGAGMPSTFTYDVMLDPNVSGVTKQIGLAQTIAPGGSDQFRLRLASDRSARYRLHVDVITVAGVVLGSGDFAVDIFVPRTPAQYLQARHG